MSKEIVMSNIIGLNPTGTLDFTGTYSMNGNNNIVKDTSSASKDNLAKAQSNTIICNHVENFENKKNNLNESLNKKNILLILIIFILLFILFFI